jgi:PleD family two-component response regulator
MMTYSNETSDQSFTDASILLASDSERHGSMMHRALHEEGLAVEYAGDYSQVEAALRRRKFDVVLLEVTSEHAVEPAVAAALRVKRSHSGQFVGYLADPHLGTRGLAGDAVLPRDVARLRQQLRELLRGDEA